MKKGSPVPVVPVGPVISLTSNVFSLGGLTRYDGHLGCAVEGVSRGDSCFFQVGAPFPECAAGPAIRIS